MQAAVRQHETEKAREEAVLSKAVARVVGLWQIPNAALAHILGISEASASRLRRGTYLLPRASKSFELGALLVRLFRALDGILGGDDAAARSWLVAENKTLGGRPIDLIQTARGLVETAAYVDAHRARI